jgi:hypothetical protein
MSEAPNPVSRVVWPRDGRPLSVGPDLRRAALLQAAVLGVVGLFVRFVLGHDVVAWVVWLLAATALVLGLARPAAFAPLHRFGQFLGRVVGTLLGWLLLAPFYVLGFGAAALVMRLRGADPMQRRMLPAGFSYWVRRRRSSETDDYTKQFRVEDRGVRAERRPLANDDGEAGR